MVTSGTWNFNPSAADVVLNAFAMVGVRRTQITTEHLENAAYQAQMVAVDFTNRQPNRWQISQVDISLVAGQAVYDLPPQTVAVSAVWLDLAQPAPAPGPISRILGPLSGVDYASIASKDQQGTPNSYYFSLLTPIPTLTLWLVPNQNPEFSMRVQTFQQMQDVLLPGGVSLDVPYRFLDAYTTGLAARLAVIYPDQARPSLPLDLEKGFEGRFQLAASLDQERVNLRPIPNLSSYYPR